MLDGDGNGYLKLYRNPAKRQLGMVLGNPIDGNTELEGKIVEENGQACA